MTDLERKLINIVQRDFPLEPRPYAAIGARVGISEDECIAALKRLSKAGILRAVRAVIDWKAIGFSTVLIGLCVDPSRLETVASEINRVAGVTHNYARTGGRINLWCTLIYDDTARKDAFLHRLAGLTGVQDVKEFPAKKTYKIGLILDV